MFYEKMHSEMQKGRFVLASISPRMRSCYTNAKICQQKRKYNIRNKVGPFLCNPSLRDVSEDYDFGQGREVKHIYTITYRDKKTRIT